MHWKIVAMIRRKLDKYIVNHYDTSKSALLLTGARQTGKTFAIRKYAESAGYDLLEINFLESPAATRIFHDTTDAAEVLLRISAFAKKRLVPNTTFIFFDEVQRCPEAVTMIKFLVDEGSYRYALSGSLLGVELKNVRSVPVGYMASKTVYPLDMEEFFGAVGVSDEVLESVRKAWQKGEKVDEVVHRTLMKLVQLYSVVGGMPAAVQAYIDTNDINVVQDKQKEILSMYKWDISQYDPDSKLFINEIFDLIPSELNAKNKRFVYKNLNEGSRFSRYENGFVWLKEAGAVLPVYNVVEPKFPLRLSEQRNLFKLFQNDVGLLTCQYAEGTALSVLSDETDINFGAIYENVVAEELVAHGFPLHYFNSKKQGELDFVIEHGSLIVPIEVKSGKDYERHRALNSVLSNADYAMEKAFVFCNANSRTEGNIRYAPIYMLMFLQRETQSVQPQLFKVDLSGLN